MPDGDLTGQIIRGYELRESIGAGGFGAVYRAYQTAVRREVAVKVILPRYVNQPEFIRRFESEAQIVARLEHPYIVPLYDFWRDPGGAYLVMRWLSGGSLRGLIRRERLPLPDMARIIDQICSALGLAHRRGVIHLDLKPDNILLDEERNGFLADFGIAKSSHDPDEVVKRQPHEPHTISGTPTYLAPEQITGMPITLKTDVYSLGIMLYELLIGQPPFSTPSTTELLQKHLYEKLPSLSLRRGDLPLELEDVLQKSTAKDPAERYPDAPSVAIAFRQALGDLLPESALNLVDLRRTPRSPSQSSRPTDQPNNRVSSKPDSRRKPTPIMPRTYGGTDSPTLTPVAPVTPESSPVSDAVDQRTITPAEFDRTITPADAGFVGFDRTVTPAEARVGVGDSDRTVTPADDILAPVVDSNRTMPPIDDLTAYQALLAMEALDNPYKGLRAFEEADAADFFGREDLIAQLGARLSESDPLARFLVVVGPSGSGKSSAVKAGLIPALRYGSIAELPDSASWFMVEMTPGAHPFDELTDALQRVAMSPMDDLADRLISTSGGLSTAVRDLLPADERVELLLLIDQFEELFTLSTDPADSTRFMDALLTAVTDPDSRLRVIITLRADFYDRPLLYPDFGELVRQRTEVVLPLNQVNLRRAIAAPAERAGLQLEADLVADIVRDVGDQPGALPLLQYALTELFERRQGRTLTRLAYRDSGGVIGALARRADALYIDLTPADQDIARQIFLRLVTPGEGVEDTRRRALRPELSIAAEDEPAVDGILDLFGQYRLLTFDRDPLTRVPTVEVAHEALLRTWGRLRDWLNASRDDLTIQRRVTSATAEWLAAGRDPGFLASEARLTQFEDWAGQTSLALSRDETDYLQASLAERAAKQARDEARKAREAAIARRAQTFARTAAILGVVGVLAVIATIVAGLQVSQTNTQLSIAGQTLTPVPVTLTPVALTLAAGNAQIVAARATGTLVAKQIVSAELAAASNRELNVGQVEPAILLGIYALQTAYSSQADTALAAALDHQYALRRITGHSDSVTAVAVSPDGLTILSGSNDGTAALSPMQSNGGGINNAFNAGHGHILSATFGPDGQTFALGTAGNTVQLYDATSTKLLHEFNSGSAALSVAYSPDGSQLLVGTESHVAQLWDIKTGTLIRTFSGHTAAVQSVAFSPDSSWIVTGSSDSTARIWDTASGAVKFTLSGHSDALLAVAVSPDGSQILTGSADQTAILWDVATGQAVQTLTGQADSVSSVAFSPDGKSILTAGLDGVANIWDLHKTSPRRVLIGHNGAINSAAFSPDGQLVITGSADHDIRIWTVIKIPDELIGHIGNVNAIAFASDGKTVFTAGSDGTVRQWDFADNELRQYAVKDEAVESVAVASDGKSALAGYVDNSVRLWDVANSKVIRLFSGHTGQINAVAFSPDDKLILTGSADHTARVWDVNTGAVRLTVQHSDWISSVAFSPDGQTFLTGSYDGTAKIWDTQTGALRQTFDTRSLGDHKVNKVLSVAFAPDGKSILTAGEGGTQTWAVPGDQPLITLAGTDTVRGAAFSPDGHLIASVDDSGSIRIFTAANGAEQRNWVGQAGSALAVAFNPIGQVLVTGGSDGKSRIWETDDQNTILAACTGLVRSAGDLQGIDNQTFNLMKPIRTTQPVCGVTLSPQTPVPTLGNATSAH